jgi:hypothetical protein
MGITARVRLNDWRTRAYNESMSDINPAPQPNPASSVVTWLALVAALVVSAGSLWLSLGMNLVACPLCFYQRTFASAPQLCWSSAC